MLVLHGHYHWFKRRTACRTDLCDSCRQETFTERFRYVLVVHIFFIPIFPVGWSSEWQCDTCGNDPRGSRPSSIGILCLGVLAFLFLFGISFIPDFAEAFDDVWMFRGITLTIILGLMCAVYFPDREAYENAREGVTPLPKDECPYCSSATVEIGGQSQCDLCGIDIL